MTDIFIERLIERHAKGLPGRKFQMAKAAIARFDFFDAPPTARQSAVLILLFPKDGQWHVVLTERVGNPNDPHSNQISFPGGSLEENDASLAFCALRETHEEVGILPETVTLIGKMTDLYIPVSNFHVHPFLAWTDAPPQYERQITEVKHVIERCFNDVFDLRNLPFILRGCICPSQKRMNVKITNRNVQIRHFANNCHRFGQNTHFFVRFAQRAIG